MPPTPRPFSKSKEIRINCAPSTGTKPFNFTWKYDDVTNTDFIETEFETNSVLQINNLTTDLNVTCIASNKAGITESTVQLLIQQDINITSNTGSVIKAGDELGWFSKCIFMSHH